MKREDRVQLIRELEEKRKSKVIAYVTSDRPNSSAAIGGDAIPFITEHLILFGDDWEKIDLFLYSRGGHSSIPWNLVSTIREFCGPERSFNVLIPYKAHSAATMIAIGADEIIMTKKGELGPIDTTMRGPYNERDDAGNALPVSAEDVMGYFALLDRIADTGSDQKATAFQSLNESVHPLVVGNVHRILQQTELVALRLLSTRAEPYDEESNRRIAKMLASEIYDHQHTISRSEARNHIGLKNVVDAEVEDIDAEMWRLFCEYREFYDFNTPFDPNSYMMENGVQTHVWNEMPLASLESVSRLDVFRQDVRSRRVKQVPPQVNLNFNGVQIPNIDIGDLPDGVAPGDVPGIIQGAVAAAAQEAINAASARVAESFLNALPTAGIETTNLNARWRREE